VIAKIRPPFRMTAAVSARTNQESFGLRIERGIPLGTRYVHRRLKKGFDFRPCVADENVQRSEIGMNFFDHPADLVWLGRIVRSLMAAWRALSLKTLSVGVAY
jgi:hypothetical protein